MFAGYSCAFLSVVITSIYAVGILSTCLAATNMNDKDGSGSIV